MMNCYQYDEYFVQRENEFTYHDNIDYEDEEYISQHFNGRTVYC